MKKLILILLVILVGCATNNDEPLVIRNIITLRDGRYHYLTDRQLEFIDDEKFSVGDTVKIVKIHGTVQNP